MPRTEGETQELRSFREYFLQLIRIPLDFPRVSNARKSQLRKEVVKESIVLLPTIIVSWRKRMDAECRSKSHLMDNLFVGLASPRQLWERTLILKPSRGKMF